MNNQLQMQTFEMMELLPSKLDKLTKDETTLIF